MRTIWKYPLNIRGWNRVPIGPDAKVILAAIDPTSGAPAIWVDHVVADIDRTPHSSDDLEARPVRDFAVFGTGHDIHPDDQHVGSMIDRSFVWHVYERGAADHG